MFIINVHGAAIGSGRFLRVLQALRVCNGLYALNGDTKRIAETAKIVPVDDSREVRATSILGVIPNDEIDLLSASIGVIGGVRMTTSTTWPKLELPDTKLVHITAEYGTKDAALGAWNYGRGAVEQLVMGDGHADALMIAQARYGAVVGSTVEDFQSRYKVTFHGSADSIPSPTEVPAYLIQKLELS
jgi:hydroxymethylpyrimidine pyrophosphatase-like HAD family hydrolase